MEWLFLKEIDSFTWEVSPEALRFLQECIDMNIAVAEEGLRHPYGITLGKSLQEELVNQPFAPEER